MIRASLTILARSVSAAVELAHRKPLALDMLDHAGRDQSRGGIGDAAHDAVGVDPIGENAVGIEPFEALAVELAALLLEVPPGDAVLDGHDHGFRPEQRVDAFGGPLQIVSLDAKDDEILLTGVGGALVGR